MHRAIILAVSTLIFAVIPARAQSAAPESRTEAILTAARQQLAKGEACLAAGNIECARREFDGAVDYIFEQGIDVRSDPRLRAGLMEIVEKIYRYETQPASEQTARLWKSQEYEGRPAAEEPEVADGELPLGPMNAVEFQRRFALLRAAFREHYDRDITLTGADHEEHRRLYGRGSAYDIRVRDLTREQVTFIIGKGNELGLRIKDFSTWERVAAHNARSAQLGRALDTYATGVHLHIDRMGVMRTPRMVERPAISKPRLQTETTKTN
ncbi:MAG TPA: hypothetical protein VKA60_14350 [Blastocatellia bacterium]|nr:hypothetical protein [Blastocatellia bacterium]